MSKVQEFLKKVAEDKALQEKMTAIMEGKPEEIGDKVVALAKKNGFEITFDEFLKEVKGLEGEVSEDELDHVAGGSSWQSVKTDAATAYSVVMSGLQAGTIKVGKWIQP